MSGMGDIRRAKEREEKGEKINWLEGIKFREPEYREHPMTGQQVRSRHIFEPEPPLSAKQRAIRGIMEGKAGQKAIGSPREFDPYLLEQFRKGALSGTVISKKDFKLFIEYLEHPASIDFSSIKRSRNRHALEILEFQIGFDRKTNRAVLYSPLKLNDRWDDMSKAFWYRSIGMTPTLISKMLHMKIKTLEVWLKMLHQYPLVRASKSDWGTGYREEGGFHTFSSGSAVDAPYREFSAGVYDSKGELGKPDPNLGGGDPTKKSLHRK